MSSSSSSSSSTRKVSSGSGSGSVSGSSISSGSLSRGVAKLTVSSSNKNSISSDISPPSGSPKPKERERSNSNGNVNSLPPLSSSSSSSSSSSKSKDKDSADPNARRRLSVMGTQSDARTVDGSDSSASSSSDSKSQSSSTSSSSSASSPSVPSSATRRRLSVMGAANASVENLDGISDPTGESKIDKFKVARSLSITQDNSKAPTSAFSSLSSGGKPLSSSTTEKKKKLFSHFVSHSKVGFVPFNPHKVNQDRPIEISKFGGNDEKAFFGVFDGHGALGHEVSSFLIKELPLRFLAQKNLESDPHAAMSTAFLETNERLANSSIDCMYSGSTGIVVHLHGKKIYSCNAGDSRAVLGRQVGDKLEAIALSDDQKPDRPDEKKRILEQKGRVEACKGPRGEDIGPQRVWLTHQDVPGLAMSRSFGDLIAASVGVIAKPEVWEREVDPNDKFFLLASDGVWEFISNQEAVDIVHRHGGDKGQFAEAAVKEIVAESVRRWNKEEEVVDDITCIIVYFAQ